MNEFPEEHVKVPSWELFILHIAVRFWTAIVFKNTSYHILHAGRKQPSTPPVYANRFLNQSLPHQLSCVQNKKDRGTVTEIYYRYSISVFSCFVIWSERTVPLKRPPASQELLAMCKMNNSREGTRTWPVLSDRILVGYVPLPMWDSESVPSGNLFICTF